MKAPLVQDFLKFIYITLSHLHSVSINFQQTRLEEKRSAKPERRLASRDHGATTC